jgi:hypothetical protein
MTKFRRLTIDELKELEKEFIEFLVVNGIAADDWEKIKKESEAKADSIVDQFSTVVFNSIFLKNQFLDYVSETEIKCFHFLDEEVVLVGMKSDVEGLDLREANQEELRKHKFDVYTTNKKYLKSREEEMFDLVEKGAVLSNGDLFKKMCLTL